MPEVADKIPSKRKKVGFKTAYLSICFVLTTIIILPFRSSPNILTLYYLTFSFIFIVLPLVGKFLTYIEINYFDESDKIRIRIQRAARELAANWKEHIESWDSLFSKLADQHNLEEYEKVPLRDRFLAEFLSAAFSSLNLEAREKLFSPHLINNNFYEKITKIINKKSYLKNSFLRLDLSIRENLLLGLVLVKQEEKPKPKLNGEAPEREEESILNNATVSSASQLAERLSLSDVKMVWFDLFKTTLDDEHPNMNLESAVIQLLSTATKYRCEPQLIQTLLKRRPDLLGVFGNHLVNPPPL